MKILEWERMLPNNHRFPDFSSSNMDPLHRKKEELLKNGIPILDLTESNPTKISINFPREILAHTWTQEFSWSYEPNPQGVLSARKAIASFYRERYSWEVDDGQIVENIWITSGTSEAYSYLFKSLTKPGDEVLIEAPGYPLVSALAELENCRPICVDWRGDKNWEKALSSRTKILCLVSPNNPTGRFIDAEEWSEICEFAEKHSITIVVDEVFSDYGQERKQIDLLEGAAKRNLDIFILNGISKLACLPGWKLGWIYHLTQSQWKKEIQDRLNWLGDSYLSCNSISQELLPTILQSRFLVINQIKNRIRRNLSLLREMAQNSLWSIEYGGAGWYAVMVSHEPEFRAEEFAMEILEKEKIFLYPGTVFSFPQNAAVCIISLLTQEDTIQSAVTLILDFQIG